MIELHARDLNTIGLEQNRLTREVKRRLDQKQPLDITSNTLTLNRATRTTNGAEIHGTYTTEQGDTIGYTFHVIHHTK